MPHNFISIKQIYRTYKNVQCWYIVRNLGSYWYVAHSCPRIPAKAEGTRPADYRSPLYWNKIG